MKPIIITLTIILSGCAEYTARADRFATTGIENVKAAKDTEAKVSLQTPCIVSIGAKVRMPEDEQKVLESYAKTFCF